MAEPLTKQEVERIIANALERFSYSQKQNFEEWQRNLKYEFEELKKQLGNLGGASSDAKYETKEIKDRLEKILTTLERLSSFPEEQRRNTVEILREIENIKLALEKKD